MLSSFRKLGILNDPDCRSAARRGVQAVFPIRTGYSITELLLVLVVVGVLAAIALPSFARILVENRVSDASSDLFGAVLVIRSEALKRRERVVLCTSVDGEGCSAGVGWHRGWIAFEDANRNGARDPDEVVLRVGEAREGEIYITGNGHLGNYVAYGPSGRSERMDNGGFLSGTITICSGAIGRLIVINRVGRPRTSPGTCDQKGA